jgi:hypothetical protein
MPADSQGQPDTHENTCNASHCQECGACGAELELNICMGYDQGAYLRVLCDLCADRQAQTESTARGAALNGYLDRYIDT